MSVYTQVNRRIKLRTVLGEDALLLTSFSGSEEISRLFNFQLEALSEDPNIKPDSIVGQAVCFWIDSDQGEDRFWHGYVSDFSAGSVQRDGLRNYRLNVVPWFWFLTCTSDCRIFQAMDVKAIIEQVLDELEFTDFDTSNIKANHPVWEYCVQYRETDFNFLSRLMEKEGIFYFFRHEEGKHTLVMSDQMNAFQNVTECEVEYSEGSLIPNHVRSWERHYKFCPGKYAQTDYNFRMPANGHKVPANILKTEEKTILNLPDASRFEIYDFPGEYNSKSDGSTYTKNRMEEVEVPHDVANGTSSCPTFTPGGKFRLRNHSDSEDRCYVVTSIRHSGVEESYTNEAPANQGYTNSFSVVPDSVNYRPARTTPEPIIQGSQTAVVTGPDGEEIWPDEFGRVKVQFFWDRYGVRDEKTTCWIRAQQFSAGKGWGAMSIPRVGQEVVVTFLEGDPDRPLITGLVYNAEQTVAYPLPDEKTKSYIKTNSSPGGDGFNEIRFEDKKNSEQVFFHAEKDMDTRVKHDKKEIVLNDRHLIVGSEGDDGKVGDKLEHILRDKHITVDRDHIEHIGGDMELKVGGIDGDGNQNVAIMGSKHESIGGDDHLVVGGDRNTKVDGKDSLTAGACHKKLDMDFAVEAQNIHLKAGTSLVLEAGVVATLKVGGNYVTVSTAGVFINGMVVLINSGGMAATGLGTQAGTAKAAKEAVPLEPIEADNSKTGNKSAPDSLS